MTRIIRTGDTPAARRNAHLRSCAEVVRLLSMRSEFDAEAKDMTAFLVFALRGIHKTIVESANVWDDRNYWKKAEELREAWRWSRTGADELEALIRSGHWEEVPGRIVQLLPHLKGVTVQSVTRNSDWWCGALRALLRKGAQE